MNDTTDKTRHNDGFYLIRENDAIIGSRNTVYDPSSLLISERVVIGRGNIFYPNVVIQCDEDGFIEIGNDNVFYPGTFVLCGGGSIRIGTGNTFGPAGCSIQVSGKDTLFTIGDRGRYCNGVNIIGQGSCGDGSQILGNITVQNCTLASGGDFTEADPDLRAAVLKGFGVAKNLQLEAGQVVNGAGDFSKIAVEWQRNHHPKASKKTTN